jgi:hypothetical protein
LAKRFAKVAKSWGESFFGQKWGEGAQYSALEFRWQYCIGYNYFFNSVSNIFLSQKMSGSRIKL